MKIESYKFGKIVIDDITYRSDLIIFMGKIIENWWREEGHYLKKSDIDKYIKIDWENETDYVIIGNGSNSMMRVDDNLIDDLKKNDIRFFIGNSRIACEKFNSIGFDNQLLFLIHLTC